MKLHLLSVVILAAAAALAVTVSVGGAAPRPGFAPGTWVGGGVQKGLFSVVPGDFAPVDGKATFTLKISSSLRASGSLTLTTRMAVDHAGLRGVITGTAKTLLSGSGSDVRFAGPMRLSGMLSDGKVSVPFAITKPLRGQLLITRANCLSVVGKTNAQPTFTWRAIPKPGTPRPKCS
jgi:hypothetical protein